MVKAIEEFNEQNQEKLNLVMFSQAIENLIKIIRGISTPSSHCLLVGLGGQGRKSLTSLACHIVEFKLRRIVLMNGYNYKEWISDLQEILITAGAKDEETVFLFRDD